MRSLGVWSLRPSHAREAGVNAMRARGFLIGDGSAVIVAATALTSVLDDYFVRSMH
jgi:hypothetical protein